MIRLIGFLLLSLSSLVYADSMGFEAPDIGAIKLSGDSKLENGILLCESDSIKPGLISGGFFQIDLSNYRNCNLVFEVKVKAVNLSKPTQPWFGHKFMLIYTTASGKKIYAESNGGSGSFEKTISFNHTVEPDAGIAELRLAMQNVSGRLEYDLSTLKITVNFKKENPELICEYSDSVKSRLPRRGVMSPIVDQANEAHFIKLKEWNVNLMRLQLNASDVWARNEPEKYDAFINEKIDKTIPCVLDLGAKYGIKIIIDLHTVPGSADGQGNGGGIFNNEEAVGKFVDIWKRIALKFREHPSLYGYDLINEPRQSKSAAYDYWQIQKVAAEAIRKIDAETPIYVSSNMRSSQYAFSYLSPLKLKNIIYEVHCYEPFSYTHTPYLKADREAGKIFPAYPGIFYGANWDLDSLRHRLQPVFDFQKRHQAKIYVGEFSVRASAPGGEQLLSDYIKIFEENGWDWTYHAFNEAKIWDLEYAGTADDDLVPSPDNPRKKVLLEAFKKNSAY